MTLPLCPKCGQPKAFTKMGWDKRPHYKCPPCSALGRIESQRRYLATPETKQKKRIREAKRRSERKGLAGALPATTNQAHEYVPSPEEMKQACAIERAGHFREMVANSTTYYHNYRAPRVYRVITK